MEVFSILQNHLVRFVFITVWYLQEFYFVCPFLPLHLAEFVLRNKKPSGFTSLIVKVV